MPELHGNTTGLSPSATRTLEHVYRRRVPLSRIATPELVRSLVEASRLTGRQVGALVHRSGQVESVVVGDSGKLFLPDLGRLRAAEGRLRGLRLVHTHLHGEPLTRDDLVDLVRLRLDLVEAIQLAPNGELRSVSYAYNVPPARPGAPPYQIVGPVPPGQAEIDFGELVQSLEAEFTRVRRARPVAAKDGRAILVHVTEKSSSAARGGEIPDRMRELAELARTAGVEVVDQVAQVRDRIDPRFVVGRGKLDDVVLRAAELDAETLIFDAELTPAQVSAIAKQSDLKIVDRTQLILDIFAQRAETRDGKLQVELAQLKYSLPKLGQKDDALSRLTGGIGGRGPGETKLEIGKRRAKERVSHLEAELRRLAKQREQRRRRRSRHEVPIVAIVGYTNAGKSTLLNTLTYADVLAEDKLFATLDTRSRRLKFPEEREVVVTDTVGFIRELPEDLFAAFRATFEETADADLVLHVVDASDHAAERHVETTEALLAELDLAQIPRLVVWNKVDLLEPTESAALAASHPSDVLVSARHRETTRALLDRIAEIFAERWTAAALVPATPEPTAEAPPRAPSKSVPARRDGEELVTLDDLLASSGRRSRKPRRADA